MKGTATHLSLIPCELTVLFAMLCLPSGSWQWEAFTSSVKSGPALILVDVHGQRKGDCNFSHVCCNCPAGSRKKGRGSAQAVSSVSLPACIGQYRVLSSEPTCLKKVIA